MAFAIPFPETGSRVILTIAHLDHVPENVGQPGDRPNLKAWCQRCHLTYDAKHHANTARETRRLRQASADLFDANPVRP